MRYTTATVAAALMATASAHTTIYGVWVNDVFQEDGRNDYIRSPPNNDPVKDTTSPDIVCNVNGATAVPSFVSANAGDKISAEWYHDNRGDDIIASSHKGPIITYIAEYFEDAGASPIWTKIDESGYDASSKTWAVDTLIANKGLYDFTLPADLATGKYMIRQEIIALHESDTCYATAGSRGAQFYPSCIQFDITGTGSAVPSQNFDFTTGYSCEDPGIEFNLYGTFDSYTIPGPEVDAELSSSGSSSGGSTGGSTGGSSAAPTGGAAATGGAQPTTMATSTTAAAETPVETTPAAAPTGSSSGSGSGSTCKRRKARRGAARH